MTTPEKWLDTQASLARNLYLVLDSVGHLDERNALINSLGPNRYRNFYVATAAQSLVNVAPYLFHLASAEHPALQALLATPQRHWGWLASAGDIPIDVLTRHWRNRLVTGERPNQAIYRMHDNRVLGRALAHLQPEQLPEYLGPMASVCYWQTDGWKVTDNLDPAEHPLPVTPAWLATPTPETTYAQILFDNCRRFLMREHTDTLVKVAKQRDLDSWLREVLALAHTWGLRAPEHIHFLLIQSLQAQNFTLPPAWKPQPNEVPQAHFERMRTEVLYWQGKLPL